MRLIHGLMALAVLGAGAARAADTEYVTVAAKINPVTQPLSPFKPLGDCASDGLCAAAAKAVATYFDVPPAITTAGLAAISVAHNISSEEYRFEIHVPPGYSFCHAYWHLTSANPPSGDRDPALGMTAVDDKVGIYAWVGHKPAFGGRSWIDGELAILGVKSDLAAQYRQAGKCAPLGTFVDCRGGGSHGRPRCDSVTH